MLFAWLLLWGLYLAIALFLWGAYVLFKAARTFARMNEELRKAAKEKESVSERKPWTIEVHEGPMVYRPDSWETKTFH